MIRPFRRIDRGQNEKPGTKTFRLDQGLDSWRASCYSVVVIRRAFAVLFGCAVALSWVAPLCAMSAVSNSAHACCQAPKAPQNAPKPCCCRPLDSVVPHPEVLVPSSSDVLLPGAVAVSAPIVLVSRAAVPVAPSRLDGSPPAPTGLSPPASV